MAMLTEPAVLIADEPTTAVDVTVQRQILDLLVTVKERGTGIIMITHDLGVARYFCDDIVVMYAGRVVERASTARVLDQPRHPYTIGLVDSCVELGDRDRPLTPIPGTPPDLARLPRGCAFHPRCGNAQLPDCQRYQHLRAVADAHEVAGWKAATDG
jgi:oligopeptide/dipeptide ABC transporter ATP-binding protein